MSTINVLDPTAEIVGAQAELASRPDTLEGKVIGLIDNSKLNSDVVLKAVGQKLQEQYRVKDLYVVRKRSGSHPIAEDQVEDLIKVCDLVVSGIGD